MVGVDKLRKSLAFKNHLILIVTKACNTFFPPCIFVFKGRYIYFPEKITFDTAAILVYPSTFFADKMGTDDGFCMFVTDKSAFAPSYLFNPGHKEG